MYTIVVDTFDNCEIYDIYMVDRNSNKLVAKILNLNFAELITSVIDYNNKYDIYKVVTVHHDDNYKPYNKKETILTKKFNYTSNV